MLLKSLLLVDKLPSDRGLCSPVSITVVLHLTLGRFPSS